MPRSGGGRGEGTEGVGGGGVQDQVQLAAPHIPDQHGETQAPTRSEHQLPRLDLAPARSGGGGGTPPGRRALSSSWGAGVWPPLTSQPCRCRRASRVRGRMLTLFFLPPRAARSAGSRPPLSPSHPPSIPLGLLTALVLPWLHPTFLSTPSERVQSCLHLQAVLLDLPRFQSPALTALEASLLPWPPLGGPPPSGAASVKRLLGAQHSLLPWSRAV